MSLINDALKKAQKQRTQEGPPLSAMPGLGGESATRIAKRDKPASANALLLWAAVGAAALVILLVGGFFLVRTMTSAPTAAAPTANVPAANPAVAVTQTAAPAASVPTPAPVAASKSTFAIPSTPLVEPVVPVATAPASVAVVPAPVAAPVVEAPKVAAPPPKMGTKAVAYIEGLRVAGIRASTSDSKVLMNDRVYRIGDMVEPHLGLRLSGITASSLTFEDEEGARYTRNFL